jgi:DNA invertase Pin-like site-specific DNA recombinase
MSSMRSFQPYGQDFGPAGFASKRAKLTPEQRSEIKRRKDEGESPKALALEFKVTASHVRNL